MKNDFPTAALAQVWWDEAWKRDDADPLAEFADEFYRVPGRIYLDGNSLGLLSRGAEAAVREVMEDWRDHAVEGWTEEGNWFTMAEQLAEQVAPLVGTTGRSVAVTGSTTVNLHQLLATLFEPKAGRTKILIDALCFPSDRYAIESHLRLRGLDPAEHIIVITSRDGRTLDENRIIARLSADIAVAILPSVVYTSGQLLDMARITGKARQRGVLIGWDCSHSIGVVPHELDEWEADCAFWCHYKYLNGGPGAVGGLYLNERHHDRAPGLAGWWGSDKQAQFDMSDTFTPAHGAARLQVGTPSILALAPLLGSLFMYEDAGIEDVRTKSLALTDFLRRIVESELAPWGFTIATPQADARRGGHLALVHPEAARLAKALRRANVVPDFRRPDILRLAPAPLYTSFADVCEAVARLKHILQFEEYLNEKDERELVP